MRDIFYYEIRKRIEETANVSTESHSNKNILINTVEKLVELSNIARHEGTLVLESAVYEMEDFPGIKYLQPMILLICDGTPPEDLEESLYCRYFSAQFNDYAALQYLLMMYGVMSMQVGRNMRLTEETLLNMLPEELTDAYRQKQEKQYEFQDTADYDMSKVDALCSDDIETCIDPSDAYYYITEMLEEALSQIDDHAIQRLLRDVDNSDLVCAMKVMSGKTRKILFDNMSQRIAVMLADDYELKGAVHLSDACEACQKIFMIFLKLVECGEIVYSEDLIIKEMAIIFLSNKDSKTKITIKESENKLYKLWNEYLQHSNRLIGGKDKNS